ncbi:dihydrolipoyllysine-residue acetyltransferase [Pseudoalteromonas luteoviolacea]|uniref:Dihydrolipoamide acetyltransferase component of pyruvate dehydrogenase complex n=1 Tax=Pseudoalteromonas luteoviolacea H33 TaxID=1365251 RepID=A0A167ABX6_9GAMM|nr:dihydrolipoyllysine-residue acetyltransferase [Pseudoalteromonas luteoviolacea]KZN45204.1 dihydrolipoamide acetyltransferase [Pseudoalteromonas luteoviolacea H33]KZN70932.1 dihydrolipoamide acetyltransferase [Pseudoalteromonas luteoviolacea H33-S]MBQ4877261.1 dihydrolipoyllysine-residue acetyltransferase [Pseudoalteromonas luteoviolacea]MBQ4906122.1 dihydrolipoyllysine-residue acetyltransferase [Pseudoalteromonas luteoviolacea]
MSKEFILPDIGEGIVECEVVEWLVAVGDTVKEDQPICDVMTDKALVQIPAVHDGVITQLHYAKGDIAKVHEPLFAMNVEGDAPVEEATAEASAAKEQPVATQSDHLEDFILPDIGEGIVECEIVEWLVSEGEEIKEDQAVCDVMTDKALVQIPAKYDGVVEKLYYQKGDIAQVHSPLFQVRLAQSNGAQAVPTKSVEEELAIHKPQAVSSSTPSTSSSQPVINGKAVASPAVRRRAREMDIDIRQVPGSGKNGRVYKEDLEKFLSAGASPAAPVASEAAPQPKTTTVSTVTGGTRVEPIRGMKAAMAKQMVASVSTIPHFTYSDEIDLTELIALRLSLKEQYAKQGIKLTMMPFFIKALSLAIKEFPILNSQVNDECTELTYFDDHNIGMAVDSKLGLLVPNIKGCQNKSIVDVAEAVTKLTDAAREGRVSPDDLKGGTISISNIGAIGGTTATPIINKPEVAIVALGKLQHLPRFDADGNVVSRSIMQVSWSGDHRVIDGGTIARFNNLWKSYLEEPAKMMMAMR